MLENCVYHIAMAADDNYAQHLGVCLVSLFTNNKHLHLNVLVFEHGISQRNKNKILEVARAHNQSVDFISLKLDDFSDFPINSYYSPVTYFRLRLADYIGYDVNKILYLDCDTIVCGDVQPLLDTDMGGYPVAAVMDTPWQINYSSEIFGIPSVSGYFNAGVMLIDMESFRKSDVFKRSVKIISEEEKLPFLDQDILNIIFRDNWLHLPCKWNLLNGFMRRVYHNGSARALEMKDGIESRCIIHYSASTKPWLPTCVHPLIGQYFKYLKLSPWNGYHLQRSVKQYMKLLYERCMEVVNRGEFVRAYIFIR